MPLKDKILLTCKDATLLTCKAQENAITLRERIQLKIHLLVCKFCALFYKQSNLLHHHFVKVNKDSYEPDTLHLDETKKNNLQLLLDTESEK